MDRTETRKITGAVAKALTYEGEIDHARERTGRDGRPRGEGWQPKPNERCIVWDDRLRDLGLRIYPSGEKAWVMRYKVAERKNRRLYRLGRFPDYTREQAEKAYSENLGRDPLAERKQAREEAKQQKVDTLAKAWAHFEAVEMKSMSPDTRRNLRGTYKRHLSTWADRELSSITRPDVEKLCAGIAEKSIYAANDAVRLLRRLFDTADVPDPSRRAKLGGRKKGQLPGERKRTDYFETDELRKIAAALDAEPDQDAADFFRLLLITGARPGEWRKAKWAWVNLKTGIFRIPADESKLRKTLDADADERVLPPAAVAILKRIRKRRDSKAEWIFPQPGGESPRHRNWYRKPWARILERAGVPYRRPYTTRHTFGTRSVGGGLSIPDTGALMGHRDSQTTLRYAHAMRDSRREAASRAAGDIESAMRGESGDVVDISTRQA